MSDSTVIRCVTIPVAMPLGDDPTCAPWTWATFDTRLTQAFRLSTDLANWCVRRLFVLDDGGAKCPDAVKKWYGYKDASENYPDKEKWAGAMTSLNLVTRAVQRKYIQQRFDVMIRHDSSLLTYRFPQPYPVHNQNWSTGYADGGFPVVRLNMPGLGRVDLRLKRSAEFGRQLGQFKQLHDGAKKAEAALYRNRKGDLLLKMVGYFPKRERGEPTNVAFVHTDPAAFLVVEVNGRSVKMTNGDHIRREITKHKSFLQRASEDKKREVRMDRRQRANFNAAIDARCGKQHHRVDTAVKQVAAQVARMCERQGVGVVAYDDANDEFFPDGFPWHALKTRLKQLLEGEMGCEWVDDSVPAFGTGFTHITDEKEKQVWVSQVRNTALAGKRVIANRNRSGSHPAVTVPKRSPAIRSPRPKPSRANAKR